MGSLFCLLLYPEPDNFTYKVQGKRLVMRELHRSLRSLVTRKLFLECLDAFRLRVEADMVPEGGKMDQPFSI